MAAWLNAGPRMSFYCFGNDFSGHHGMVRRWFERHEIKRYCRTRLSKKEKEKNWPTGAKYITKDDETISHWSTFLRALVTLGTRAGWL